VGPGARQTVPLEQHQELLQDVQVLQIQVAAAQEEIAKLKEQFSKLAERLKSQGGGEPGSSSSAESGLSPSSSLGSSGEGDPLNEMRQRRLLRFSKDQTV